jgi:hypothetical protein
VIALDASSPWSYERVLTEWAEAKLVDGSWRDALLTAVDVSAFPCANVHRGPDSLGLEFAVPKFTIYRAICERLEMLDCLTDAIECSHQMESDTAVETNIDDGQEKWVLGEWSRIPCRPCL